MNKITLCFLIHAGFLAVLSALNPTAIYRIFPQAIHEKPVSPLIYGNFIELGLARQIEVCGRRNCTMRALGRCRP
jgi:hypothetical protein